MMKLLLISIGFKHLNVLEDNIESANSIYDGWSQTWEAFYGSGASGSWMIGVTIARYIALFTFVWAAAKLFLHLESFHWIYFRRDAIALLIIGALMMQNGVHSKTLIRAERKLITGVTQLIYEIKQADVTYETAVRDVLISLDVKQQLEDMFRACEYQTGSAQINCLKAVGDEALEELNNVESVFGIISGVQRYIARITAYRFQLDQLVEGNVELVKLATLPIVGSVVNGYLYQFLKGVQWAFLQCFELGNLLVAVTFLPAVSLSLGSANVGPLLTWIAGAAAIAATTWSYAFVVGILASNTAITGMTDFSDIGFMITVAAAAPVLAIRIGKFSAAQVAAAVPSGILLMSSALPRLILRR